MPAMILANARAVFANEVSDGMEFVLREGKIAEVRGATNSSKDVIDLRGNYLAPGFIDLHIHGAVGHDTMEGSVDGFRAICDHHASGGTTSLLLTTATVALPEIFRVLASIRDAAVAIPQIAGAHVEGPFISPERPGAQRAEFIRSPDPATTAQFLDLADVMRRITVAPEIPGALDMIKEMSARGIAISGGHSNAWDDEARAGFDCGMKQVTHTFNCMSSMRRRGRERVAGLLEFALSEPSITCELIADGHHVSTTLMKMLYRAKGARGICLVTDATAGAGLANGSPFELAGKKCVVDDGVCLLDDRSALAGSASRMIDLVRTMVNDVGVPLPEAVAMATANPARALNSIGKGKLEPGADADLVVLSPDLDVLQTFVRGEEIFRR